MTTDKKNYCNVLIVGSLPFRVDAQSRAFDTYFCRWPSEKLHQVFSSPLKPLKGHCSELYQITDYDMLTKFFHRKRKIDKIFYKEKLDEKPCVDSSTSSVGGLYKIGKKKTPFIKLLRSLLWREKKWWTLEFKRWLAEFRPQCIFLAWSDDTYLLKIAYKIAHDFDIPVVPCIGDDYYFNRRFSLNPFYYLFNVIYKKWFKKLITYSNNCIFIDDKIRNTYKDFFGIDGATVHVCSNYQALKTEDKKIDCEFIYVGNLGYKRYESLILFAKIMSKKKSNFRLRIFSSTNNKRIIGKLKKTKGIEFCGAIEYGEIINEYKKSTFVIVAESIKNKRAISDVAYSLSTKVADSLASGLPIVALGNKKCGAIDFFKRHSCAIVLEDVKDIYRFSNTNLENIALKEQIKKQHEVFVNLFDKQKNTVVFEKSILKSIEDFKYGKEKNMHCDTNRD